jgi:hypothetical protein
MIEIVPPSPTAADFISISATFSGCVSSAALTRSDASFSGYIQRSEACFSTPPGTKLVFSVGQLPAGDYTVTIQTRAFTGVVQDTQTTSFSVSAGSFPEAIPALDSFWIAVLAVGLAVAGMRALRHRGEG